MKKGKKYFIGLAAKKMHTELTEVWDRPIYALVIHCRGGYEMLCAFEPFMMMEYDEHEVEPYHMVLPRTARGLRKEVKDIRCYGR